MGIIKKTYSINVEEPISQCTIKGELRGDYVSITIPNKGIITFASFDEFKEITNAFQNIINDCNKLINIGENRIE